VLNVLDFPDNIEEKFRRVLEKQDDKTLIELASKQKSEILSFLKSQNEKENNKEDLNNKEKTQLADSKISKLQSIFTPELLNNNPDIKDNFEALELAKTPEEKEAIVQGVINILKTEP
jgi:hypothetical protein